MHIETNGTRIHVAQQGSGELALVFLHYYGGSSRTWDAVAAQLAHRYRIVATDNRGWGRSDAPAEGYRIADLAAEQIERAADYLSSTSGDALLEDVERLARSKPWLATGAAALTGFVASRALSASRRERNGGGYVDRDAGSDFDEADAEAAYPDEPSAGRSRS